MLQRLMTPTPASSSRSRSSVPSPADDGPFGGASSPDRLAPFGPEQRPRILAALETDAEIQAAIAVEAAASGESTAVLAARVRTYADEIVPQFNARRHHRLAYRLARRLATLLFRVRVGHVDEGVIIDIPPDASVVFVINHRSNIDYVLVAFLAAEHVAISFAVGEWARVWPLDSLVRSLGAFFVRRDSRNRLYRKVLERYVYLAVTHGVTQAVFMEGGLSRDGRLRPPKLGLLSYLTRHMRRDSVRDVVFVPVAVNYDRVLEDRHLLRDLEPEDLLKYGLIPEFVGRLPVVATLEDLDEASLKKILTEPKNALVKQYQRLFEMESIDLTLAEEALGAISRKAIERKTGARGLRSIMEGILLDTMFDLPSLKGVEEVVIGPEVVEGGARPLRIYSERAEEKGSSA